MKTTFKLLALIALTIGLMFSALSQNVVTMKYKFPGGQGIVTFDTVYGDQSRGANSFKLAVKDINGNLLTGQSAYNLLSQPIWGDAKTFGELLPTLTPDIGSPTLNISNYKKYDPANGFKPTENIVYSCRRPSGMGGWVVFNPMPLASEIYWPAIGITEYKKASDPDSYSIPNPDYVNNAAIRDAEKLLYKQLLFDNFVMLGDAIFPRLYDNLYPKPQVCTWWILIDRKYMEVPVVNGKYPGGRKLVPWIAARDINFVQWQGYMSRTMLVTPVEKKLKTLLGLPLN